QSKIRSPARKQFAVRREGQGDVRQSMAAKGRLHQQSSEAGAGRLRGKKRSTAAIRKQIETCRERGYKPPQKRWAKTGWNQWQINLLGTAPDAAVAARIGRSVSAVRAMRWRVAGRQLEHSKSRQTH